MPYIELLTKPSGQKLFLLLLAVMSMQTITSIQHIYQWFLAGISKISQNSYYYLLSTEMKLDQFATVTIRKAISLIDGNCKTLPILLLLDDTMQEKYGAKFECYSTMFDHAYHNASSKLLPLIDSTFAPLAASSPQTAKYAIGDLIRRDLFFADFVAKLENSVISSQLLDSLYFSDIFDLSS